MRAHVDFFFGRSENPCVGGPIPGLHQFSLTSNGGGDASGGFRFLRVAAPLGDPLIAVKRGCC
jgi:hypothetical protein